MLSSIQSQSRTAPVTTKIKFRTGRLANIVAKVRLVLVFHAIWFPFYHSIETLSSTNPLFPRSDEKVIADFDSVFGCIRN